MTAPHRAVDSTNTGVGAFVVTITWPRLRLSIAG